MAKLRVSDHALLRFLERAGGCDVEALRDAVAQSLHRAHIAATSIGAQEYLITADGLSFVVRGDVVTTMLLEPSVLGRAVSLSPDSKA